MPPSRSIATSHLEALNTAAVLRLPVPPRLPQSTENSSSSLEGAAASTAASRDYGTVPVHYYALFNNNLRRADIADYHGCGEQNNFGLRPDIPFEYAADHNRIGFNNALNPSKSADEDSAVGFNTSRKVTVDS